MQKIKPTIAPQYMTSKKALVMALETKVAEINTHIGQYERKLRHYTKLNDQELIAMYERKLARAQSIKKACEQTIFAQKQLIKGR